MPTNEFIVKRGMVFYLDSAGEQQSNIQCQLTTKSRPYIVVSNDTVNERASIVHVLPITSQPPRSPHMPWMVPFKKRDGSVNWVRANEATCIPRRLLTCANYSESFSNIVADNKGFMARITEMLARHFAIITGDEEMPSPLEDQLLEDHRAQVSETPITDATVTEQARTDKPITFGDADSITISFSVGGIGPVQFTIGKNSTASQITVPEQHGESISETSKIIEPNKNSRSKRLSKDKITALISVIEKQCRVFGGSLTRKQIAEMFGVSDKTVAYYVMRIKDAYINGDDTMSVADHKKVKSIKLSKLMQVKFMRDYKELTLEQMFEKYRKYGFTGTTHIYYHYKYLCNKANVKKCEEVMA